MITPLPQLTRGDFASFFREVTCHDPFAWQERLVDHLVETGCWPQRISAPTGAGKTSVIDIHVFAVALSVVGIGARVPRRLAVVVDRRVLVDDQYEHARQLQARLSEMKRASPVIARVAAALSTLRHPAPGAIDGPLMVARLRGAEPPSTQWRFEPEACSVICATPDMWGSRLLMRGYGSSRGAWPVEAGLLSMDAAVVVDEAHLSRQLIRTARRVAQLQQHDADLGVPRLQCIETSATPAGTLDTAEGTDVGVTGDDLVVDAVLAERMTASKMLRVVTTSAWPPETKNAATRIAELVEETMRLVDEVADAKGPQTIGCFVNTVRDAVAVYGRLGERGLSAGEDMVLVCGRMRRIDLDRIRQRHPGLLTIEGNPRVKVIVTTQSLEVGVDLDLAGAVSELAPASALAQRAGRVNRLGRRSRSVFSVVAPEGLQAADDGAAIERDGELRSIKTARIGPYATADLVAAHDWIGRLEPGQDIAPWTVRESSPPVPNPGLPRRLERSDAWHLSTTSVPLSSEPDLDVWLSDDLGADLDVGVVVRSDITGGPEDLEYLRATRIHSREVYPAGLGEMRKRVDELMKASIVPPMYRVTDGADPERLTDARLRPGDIIVIGTDVALVDGRSETVSPSGTEPGSDVFEEAAEAGGWADLRFGPTFLAARSVPDDAVTNILEACLESDLATRDGRDALAEGLTVVALMASDEWWRTYLATVGRALKGRLSDFDVAMVGQIDRASGENGAGGTWLAITDRRSRPADDQVELVADDTAEILLVDHLRQVAARAESAASDLGLTHDVVVAMTTAGWIHDSGKTDRRFQMMLGGTDDAPLAKSEYRQIGEIRAAQARSGLPPRWRHEQRSLLDPTLHGETAEDDLVYRLVGTHHGHGRPLFPHDAVGLLADGAGAEDLENARGLFDDGHWNTVVDRTHERFGVWGCAYLEAVFRGADVQVSRDPATASSASAPAPVIGRSDRQRPRSDAFTVTLGGAEPQILASHLVLSGLGAILSDAFGDDRVRLGWSASMNPRPFVLISGIKDWPEIYQALVAHAHAACTWLDEDFRDSKGKARALMSPRRDIAPGDWEAFEDARHRVIDTLDGSQGDVHQKMIGGLGKPSHWHRNQKGEWIPDFGASRFDTQPRNAGSELISNRLRKDGAVLRELDADGAWAALTDPAVGSDDPSACAGLAPNGTFGSVMSWFAHWGMALCPVAPRAFLQGVSRRSMTTTFADQSAAFCALPMVTGPVRVSRLRGVLSSRHVVDFGALEKADPRRAVAGTWLAAHGVPCVATFTFRNDGSANAAKWVANLGRLVPVDG